MQGTISPDNLISASDRKEGQYNAGDLIRCEVVDVNADAEKLVCGVKGVHHQGAGKADVQFGLVTKDQLPKHYRYLFAVKTQCSLHNFLFTFIIMPSRAMMEAEGRTYEDCLQSNRAFLNPSAVQHLAASLGLNINSTTPNSFLKGLKYVFSNFCITF